MLHFCCPRSFIRCGNAGILFTAKKLGKWVGFERMINGILYSNFRAFLASASWLGASSLLFIIIVVIVILVHLPRYQCYFCFSFYCCFVVIKAMSINRSSCSSIIGSIQAQPNVPPPVTSSVLRRLRRVRLQPPVLHADRGRPPRRGRRMAVAGRPPAEGSLQRQGPRPALRRDPHTSFVDPHGCTLHSRVSVGELSRVRVYARACDVCDWSNTCKRMKWFLLRFRGRSAPPSWLHIHLSFS